MTVDYLIVGGGICGTLLSHFLEKEGKSFLLLDDERSSAASAVAAGVINPVTGRRYVYTWMIDTVMPFAVDTYKELGAAFGIETIFTKSIIDFFPSAQMRDAFVTRITEDDTYLHTYPDQNHFNQYVHYHFGCGEIRPAYTVNMQLLLAAWRKKLAAADAFLPLTFTPANLTLSEDSITYGNIRAQKIIFCDGIAAVANPLFSLLPFSPNKGEALIIHCPGLTNEHILKRGLMLVPLPDEDTYWVGANYQWEFEDDKPSSQFYDSTTTLLQQWLKPPFTVLEHKAAVRPATLERRPFVGLHPQQPSVAILNGMGTKGASLAPYFAHQLAQHLVHGSPIDKEADVHRFSRILSK